MHPPEPPPEPSAKPRSSHASAEGHDPRSARFQPVDLDKNLEQLDQNDLLLQFLQAAPVAFKPASLSNVFLRLAPEPPFTALRIFYDRDENAPSRLRDMCRRLREDAGIPFTLLSGRGYRELQVNGEKALTHFERCQGVLFNPKQLNDFYFLHRTGEGGAPRLTYTGAHRARIETRLQALGIRYRYEDHALVIEGKGPVKAAALYGLKFKDSEEFLGDFARPSRGVSR